MSQGIMERNLPVAESIQSGDKIRIVTSAGNSKQVDASQIGGGSGVYDVTVHAVGQVVDGNIEIESVDTSAQDIISYLMDGKTVGMVLKVTDEDAPPKALQLDLSDAYVEDDTPYIDFSTMPSVTNIVGGIALVVNSVSYDGASWEHSITSDTIETGDGVYTVEWTGTEPLQGHINASFGVLYSLIMNGKHNPIFVDNSSPTLVYQLKEISQSERMIRISNGNNGYAFKSQTALDILQYISEA